VKHTLLVLLTGAVVAGVPAYAHHSFARYYFESQSTSIEGEVQEFQYRNPHALLLVRAADDTGQMRVYTAEWGGPSRLARAGIQGHTLKPGDRVIVTGSPGRNPSEYKLHLKGLHRPADGLRWPVSRR
jgi:hypothetical protein